MTGTSRRVRFGHLEIEYDDRVLAPRDWTRQQSAWAAELLEDLPAGDVLEICAGAGHIGLLAVAGTGRRLVQVDADETACAYARANAARAGGSVDVRHGWMEDALDPEEPFTLVIADPPWVRSDETDQHAEDPLSAIDGGADGLDGVRGCLAVISRHLVRDGAAILQVGDEDQALGVAKHLTNHPELALEVDEHRVLDGGALVHLTRSGTSHP